MAIENHLRALFLTKEAITDIVGEDDPSGQIARVFYDVVPQGTVLAAISITMISGFRTNTLTGPDGWANPRVQIDCYAPTLSQASTLANLVRRTLNGYKGTLENTRVGDAHLMSERTFFDPVLKLHRKSLDFTLWHTEETAAPV